MMQFQDEHGVTLSFPERPHGWNGVAGMLVRSLGPSAHEMYRTAQSPSDRQRIAMDEADYLNESVKFLARAGRPCMAHSKRLQLYYWMRRCGA